MNTFLSCLFDETEATCFTLAPRGITVTPIRSVSRPEEYAYFSINALHPTTDLKPTEDWHRAETPRRCDDNVVSFRNILIEMDKMEIEEQRAYISKIGLPYSTAVFSGSKSIHFVISLTTPVPDRRAYDSLVKRVYKAVGFNKLDRTCKNPSRLSRMPRHVRADTGQMQELLRVQGRVDNRELENWLILHGAPPEPEVVWEDINVFSRPKKDFSSLLPATRNFIMNGKSTERGAWNISLFKAAADFCRTGYSQEEAIDELLAITGFLDKTDEKTINSAYRNEMSKSSEEPSSNRVG